MAVKYDEFVKKKNTTFYESIKYCIFNKAIAGGGEKRIYQSKILCSNGFNNLQALSLLGEHNAVSGILLYTSQDSGLAKK